MKYFCLGLFSAITGFFILLYCSLFGDAAVELGAPRHVGGYVGNVIGFMLLFGGPLFFWVINPLVRRQRMK